MFGVGNKAPVYPSRINADAKWLHFTATSGNCTRSPTRSSSRGYSSTVQLYCLIGFLILTTVRISVCLNSCKPQLSISGAQWTLSGKKGVYSLCPQSSHQNGPVCKSLNLIVKCLVQWYKPHSFLNGQVLLLFGLHISVNDRTIIFSLQPWIPQLKVQNVICLPVKGRCRFSESLRQQLLWRNVDH